MKKSIFLRKFFRGNNHGTKKNKNSCVDKTDIGLPDRRSDSEIAGNTVTSN